MSRDNVLSVASAKGGVGKTTTSINLGAAVAANTSQRVVLLEADLGMANVLDFLDLPVKPGTDPSLHDVLAGTAAVDDAIVEFKDGYSLLPCGDDLDDFRRADPRRLAQVIDAVRSTYDVVIVDTPAGMGGASLYPLVLADDILLVATPRVSAIRDTQKTKEIAERTGSTVTGLLLTMTGDGNAPAPERLAEFLGTTLIGTVPNDPAVAKAQDAGEPVIEYDPDSPAAEAYLAAAVDVGLVPEGTTRERVDPYKER